MKKTIAIILASLIILWACGGGRNQDTATVPEESIIMLGDSFMAIHDWSNDFPGTTAYNEGVSGETTSEILLRIPNIIENYEPQQVFIIAGINDINRDAMQSWQVMINYAEIIEQLSLYDFKVTVISTCYFADLGSFSEKLNPIVYELNSLLSQYCQDNLLGYIDLVAIVCREGHLDTLYDIGDGVHLNSDGYLVLTDLILHSKY